MAPKVFSDADLSVHTTRSPKGLHVHLKCQTCERDFEVLHPWPEIRMMLEGHPVSGVKVSADREFWEVVVQCTDQNCLENNTYRVTADELEEQAQRELARRKRLGQ
jgi:hypothetical protein